MKKFLSILAVSMLMLFAADNVVAANQLGGGKTPHVKGFVSNGFWDNWEIQGGVGTAGSANMGDRYAMFEAIHGSAPRMIEDGLGEYANPSSIFKAAEMMVRHIGLTDKADRLAAVLADSMENGPQVTGLADGAKGSELADYVIERL